MKKKTNNHALLFIPHIWKPYHEEGKESSLDDSIRTMWCEKEQIQWIYRIVVKRGMSEYEELSCPCCGGKLDRGFGNDSGFSCSEMPEVLGCLFVDKKTLRLVFTPLSFETARKDLLDHILKHDFSDSFKKVEVWESSLTFQITEKLSTKKLISASLLLSSIVLKKNKTKRKDALTRINEGLKVKIIPESKESRLQRKKYSELAARTLMLLEPFRLEKSTESSPTSESQKTSLELRTIGNFRNVSLKCKPILSKRIKGLATQRAKRKTYSMESVFSRLHREAEVTRKTLR